MNQTLVQHLREKEQRMKEIRRYLHENLNYHSKKMKHLNILQTFIKIRIV